MQTISKLVFTLLILAFVSCNKSDSEPEEERLYTKSVERISSSNFEADLIDKAEKYYPPREDVLEVQGYRMGIPDTLYWYYDSFDGVLLPYAITYDAIVYYSGLIDQFNANKVETFFLSASFEYKAEVTFHENYNSPSTFSDESIAEPKEYNSVYVVSLSLKWSDYCGSLCALWINKDRIAVFNENGELLKVYLDGLVPIAVA